MEFLKQSFFLLILCFGLFFSPISAGNKGKGGDGFRKAAKNYDKKAEEAKKAGKGELAKLYHQQAEIKRKNAKLADQGKGCDWKEYYKNDKEIKKLSGHEHGKKGHHKKGHDHKKKDHKNKEGKPGDGFRETAKKYDAKSKEAGKAGNKDLAKLYKRQAEIKRAAAELGDDGKWKEIDWKEYQKNDIKIQGHNKGKKHHKKKH
ncbi:MAG: hypothetical protein COA79_15280 [Planctomycetota bacterium]|nr:MAG: hypothetical protein COA79_15280 [Planctomycetota bacterium]